MSALGQKPTFAMQTAMSALPPKADIPSAENNVCFVPQADICSAPAHVRFTPNSDIDCVFRHVCFGPIADISRSLDHLVGTLLELQGHDEA
jgi:hypothetical protein